MQVYKIPPFDQNLSVDGRHLTDTKQTLGQLRVLPKSLIYLRADEPAPGSAAAAAHVSETEECWTSQNPEEGFKGRHKFYLLNYWMMEGIVVLYHLTFGYFHTFRISNLNVTGTGLLSGF